MNEPPGSTPPSKIRKGPKTAHILAGLLLGAVAGVVANLAWGKTSALAAIIHYGTEPAGQMWLRALIMVVIPLVFSRLTLGVAGLGDLHKLGRVGLKTLLFFLLVTTLAAVLGLTLVNLVRPGVGLSAEARERLLETYHKDSGPSKETLQRGQFGIQTLVNVVPRNPLAAAAQGDMLGVIFFSLAFGVALALLPSDRTKALVEALQGLGDVMIVIIDLVMKLAPYGVFALLFTVTARFGLDLLVRLGWYILTVIAGLAIFEFGVYPALIRVFTGWSPWNFFRRAWTAILTAFSTSSSNATLPTTLEVCEDSLGLPREICGFVIPLGATLCMNGTALFEGRHRTLHRPGVWNPSDTWLADRGDGDRDSDGGGRCGRPQRGHSGPDPGAGGRGSSGGGNCHGGGRRPGARHVPNGGECHRRHAGRYFCGTRRRETRAARVGQAPFPQYRLWRRGAAAPPAHSPMRKTFKCSNATYLC